MESTLPLPFLVSVVIPPGLASSPGLSRDEVARLGCVFLEATAQNLPKLQRFLAQHGADFHAYVDGSRLASRDNVASLLDGGARKVFLAPEDLGEYAGEFAGRVAPVVSAKGGGLAKVADKATEHGLLVTDFAATEEQVDEFMRRCQAEKLPHLFLKPDDAATPDLAAFLDVAGHCSAVPIVPSTRLTTDKADGSRLLVDAVIARHWRSDRPDGLVPTVVADEGGVALGLVYSSAESVGESLRTGTGVYQSRKRGLWYKGATSGDTQELVRVALDCDNDSLRFTVRQKGGFCHLDQHGCFGDLKGLARLEKTLKARKEGAPEGSYTARLFADEKLLRAKIMEEAEELCNAKTPEDVAFEAADLIYFALTKAVGAGVTLADIERSLDAKSLKVTRRKGDAKGKWAEKEGIKTGAPTEPKPAPKEAAAPSSEPVTSTTDRIAMKRYDLSRVSAAELDAALRRPSQKSSEAIMGIVRPIVEDVARNGDAALLAYTHKFDKATSLISPVLRAPFPAELMALPAETVAAIDVSFDNIRKFHAAQKEDGPLNVETMPGVVCSRFARPIERVGLYVPGGTAVLPSTALMLGVPAMVAGCKTIVLASPPRSDGTVTPEIVYVAHRVGADAIVLAGGAQAVAALAYGTESVPKVDKILGPGNQFVTAAKMLVSNDTSAGVGIDMPAGPSEVLVVADGAANPAFVASDLLSQAEHGTDSQVVLLAVGLSDAQLDAVDDELHAQASALPRVDIIRGAIEHSVTVRVETVEQAMEVSNRYAPEHLILQVDGAEKLVDLVQNAGSVFVGPWTPESVGDYSAGVNHSLPTYGYAKQYSGVNLGSFVKHITSSNLTAQGLRNVGGAVMQLAKVEELEAHRRAVSIRLDYMDRQKGGS